MATSKPPRFGVSNDKAHKVLTACDTSMANIKKFVGTKNGNTAANSGTLIGSVEYLATQAYDGKDFSAAYKKFNDTILKDIRSKMAAIDSYLQYMDQIAK